MCDLHVFVPNNKEIMFGTLSGIQNEKMFPKLGKEWKPQHSFFLFNQY